MSTLKVDTITNGSSAVNLPNNFKVGGLGIEQGYTASGSEPSSPSTGDFWWDSTNEKLYRYISGGFKEITIVPPAVQYGDRAVVMGGYDHSQQRIQYFDITTTGNATDFGDLYVDTYSHGPTGFSNATRGCCAGGSGAGNQVIQFVVISTTADSTDFGDLAVSRYAAAACADGTYGVILGGYGNEGNGNEDLNHMEYVTIATSGNGTNFGDLISAAKGRGIAACANDTRGLAMAGQGSTTDDVQYFTIATPGNATSFGDLTHPREYTSAFANQTRGCCAGGDSDSGGNTNSYNTNVIDYVTISTPGNATDFGNLSNSLRRLSATSNFTRGVTQGGSVGTSTGGSDARDNIDYVTIDTTGNATNFGDLLEADTAQAATSGNAS